MTRCIGYAASSPPLPRKSATAVKPDCVDSSMLVTPTGRYAPPGTQPKRYEASTGSTLRSPLSDTPSNSQTTSNTNPAHPRSTSWVAPSPAGPPRSPTGTSPEVTNGPTEALNNLIKRIKRAAFGLPNFANYRIRALLYAGKPNWDLLATVTPH